MNLYIKIPVLLCLLAGTTMSVQAQAAVPPPMPDYQPLPAAQLDQLLDQLRFIPTP